ncbi:conjugal transfer mating-pair stabilization protein TraG [Shewanella vaxholmensis]|uniref:Conjugal transfer mating-pair stabilization protein TraG n=1 Tax=Shewanella vaxholmensis TaxID=3063535 RepID=A0ABU9UW31_9GAMM
MAVEIFTYSNGDVAKQVMNAIAVLFKSDSFASMISICALFAVVATALHFFIKRDHNAIMKWCAVYFAVPLLAMNTTATVQITDLTNPTGNYRVDNVPAIVAFPASWASHYMYATTQTVEDIFHVPDDQQYSKTGMMFGSELYKLSRQSEIENTQLKGYWQHYISSCIRGDMLLNNKYTWRDLASAPDIWDFLATHNPSPLRAIQMGSDDYPTCKEALPRLKQLFQADSAKSIKLLGSWIYGEKATSQQSFLNTSISSGYQKYANISQSASQITLQNMTINALRNGLADDAAVSNNTAAAFNYAYTQNKMQTTSMWAGMALQAREFLPMLQSILFLLFSSVAFLVVAIAMIPSLTFQVLGNYFKGFIYLGTWPVMFALINFIMTTRLSLNATEITNIYGGITLSNVDPLQEMHSRYAAMTGFLMMSVPTLIVPLIMKGGASVMSSMSHQFAGMMSSVNARTSASAASGDINLGNAQVDNYSYNNTNGNKIDTTGVERIHGNTKQDATGYETTTFDDGKQVISGQNALSRSLPVNISGSDVVTNSASQSASNAISASQSTGEQLNQTTSAIQNQSSNLSHGLNKTSSYGSNSSTSEAGNHRKSVADLSSLVESYGKEFGRTKDEAWNDAIRMNADAKMGVTVGTPGKGLFGSGASAEASTGTSASADESNSTRLSDSERVSRLQSYQEQFSSNIDKVKSYSSGEQSSNTHAKSDSEMQSFVDSINQSESLAKTQHAQLTEAQSYTDLANNVKSGSISIGRDFNQDFVDYVGNARKQEGDAMDVIKGQTPEMQQERNQLAAEFVNSPEVKAMVEQYKNHELPQNRDDIIQTQERYAADIDFNKQQSPQYAPAPLNDSLYQTGEFERIQGHAAQGNTEIMQDVWSAESKHVPANLPTIDREQARAEAEAAHALVQIPQDNRSDDEKMAETVRQSSPFNTGPKM